MTLKLMFIWLKKFTVTTAETATNRIRTNSICFSSVQTARLNIITVDGVSSCLLTTKPHLIGFSCDTRRDLHDEGDSVDFYGFYVALRSNFSSGFLQYKLFSLKLSWMCGSRRGKNEIRYILIERRQSIRRVREIEGGG